MKTHTKVVFSMMAIFAVALMLGTPSAFADHPEVTITTVDGSGFSQECVATGCYDPSDAVVDVGGTVIFSNTDASPHTFTAGTVDGFTPSPSEEFDTEVLMQDEIHEWIPETAGEIPYYCALHTWMVGTITVQEVTATEEEDTHDEDTHDEDTHDEDTHDEDTHDEDKMMDDSKMSMKINLDEIMAQITTSDGMMNEPMTIDLTMTDLDGNGIEHITYNIKATQGTEVVLDEEGHMHQGTLTNSHVTAVLPADASDSMPVVILVESVGFGHDDMYEAVSGEITTMQVVPEFGTIAMMILAIAIISIVAVSAKSRLSIMPRI